MATAVLSGVLIKYDAHLSLYREKLEKLVVNLIKMNPSFEMVKFFFIHL